MEFYFLLLGMVLGSSLCAFLAIVKHEEMKKSIKEYRRAALSNCPYWKRESRQCTKSWVYEQVKRGQERG